MSKKTKRTPWLASCARRSSASWLLPLPGAALIESLPGAVVQCGPRQITQVIADNLLVVQGYTFGVFGFELRRHSLPQSQEERSASKNGLVACANAGKDVLDKLVSFAA